MGIRGIHHIGISTRDLEQLVGFYRDHLGFEVTARSDWRDSPAIDAALGLEGSAGDIAMLRLGDVSLELFQFADPPPDRFTDRPVSAPGLNHISLVVDDLDAEVTRLTAAGMRFHGTPVDIGDGPFVYGRDPDGNVVELWQIAPGAD